MTLTACGVTGYLTHTSLVLSVLNLLKFYSPWAHY
jgi:hypothetical protein